MGGARRDEEKARAKERFFSFRDEFGQWDPKNQRPELWNLYNGRHRKGEHIRVFPLSNWTELDIWQYIADEEIELPSIYFAHRREVFRRDGMLMAVTEFLARRRRRGGVRGDRALPHRRRRDVHRRGRVERGRRSTTSSPRSRRPASPSGARPAPTTRSPKPPWKTASGRATSRWNSSASPRPVRSTTASRTLIGRLLYDSKQIFEDTLDALEHSTHAARRGGA